MALRSFRTRWAASWSDQKSGAAALESSWLKRVRSFAPSKEAPDERDALAELFVAVFEVFEDHFVVVLALVFGFAFVAAIISVKIVTIRLSQGTQSP
jgi:hypothetical protein